MILLIAGNYREAQYWAKESELKPTEWKYVSSEKDLLGRRGSYIAFCGEWWKNPSGAQPESVVGAYGLRHYHL